MFVLGSFTVVRSIYDNFHARSLTSVSAAQGSITIEVPNYNETFTNTQARQLASVIALILVTGETWIPGNTVADISVLPYPANVSPEPWPGATITVTGASPVFTINLTQDQARQLVNAISLYTVTYQ